MAFERLCLNHIAEIREALGIRGVQNSVCSWRGRGAQIDLLLDRSDRVVNICEMKYVDGPFKVEKDDDELLRQRRNVFTTETDCKKSVHLTLVTTYGLAPTKWRGVFQSVITLDDLFKV